VLLIKRIVATGGQVVSLRDGHLYVDGVALAVSGSPSREAFGKRVVELNLADGGGPPIERLSIPPGKLLAIGDHRGGSLDARSWGLIDERELYGRAVAVYIRKGDGYVWKTLEGRNRPINRASCEPGCNRGSGGGRRPAWSSRLHGP
jgi:signal peptidase I